MNPSSSKKWRKLLFLIVWSLIISKEQADSLQFGLMGKKSPHPSCRRKGKVEITPLLPLYSTKKNEDVPLLHSQSSKEGYHAMLSPRNERKQQSIITTTLSATGGGSNDDGTEAPAEDAPSSDRILKSRLILVFVAFLYGTLNVSIRQIYSMPDPPTASALSMTRGWLAASCFLPFIFESKTKRNPGDEKQQNDSFVSSVNTTNGNLPPLWKVALELAFWNFCAQGLLNVGLLYTQSSRAAFLTQLSVVMTPLISLFAGQSVQKTVWAGCVFALVGLALLSSGGGEAAAAADATANASAGILDLLRGGNGNAISFSFGGLVDSLVGTFTSLSLSTGDWLILGGATSWSIYLFRTSCVGDRYPEIPLQALKITLLALLYTLWFVVSAIQCCGGIMSGAEIQWMGWKNIISWAILAYSAIGPGALADVLQQQGQKDVSASEANVILSLEPVFTALCAQVLLGEVTSIREGLGGALILFAALLASR